MLFKVLSGLEALLAETPTKKKREKDLDTENLFRFNFLRKYSILIIQSAVHFAHTLPQRISGDRKA